MRTERRYLYYKCVNDLRCEVVKGNVKGVMHVTDIFQDQDAAKAQRDLFVMSRAVEHISMNYCIRIQSTISETECVLQFVCTLFSNIAHMYKFQ